jgi:hypothetical protein
LSSNDQPNAAGPSDAPTPAVTLMPAERFEWERLIRRVIVPVPTDRAHRRGAPSRDTVKLVALLLATYANPDGTRVRPGDNRLVAVTGKSKSVIKRCLALLRSMGLIHCVVVGSSYGRRGWTSEYRLTIPQDALERFELLPPDELLSEHGSPATCEQAGDEVPENADHGSQANPVDPAEDGGEGSQATPGYCEQGSQAAGTGVASEPPPDHHHPQQPPDHLYSSSTVTVPPAPRAVDDGGDESDEDDPGGERCTHGLRAGRRPDGSSTCALCRRGAGRHLRALGA